MLDQFQAESKTSHKLRIVENVGRKKEADVGKIQDDMAPLHGKVKFANKRFPGGRLFEWQPPWSAISSLPPVVLMMVATTSPRSSPGTQWPSPGKQLATLLWRDTTMLLSLFQLHSLNVNLKSIQNIKHNWQHIGAHIHFLQNCHQFW